MDTLLFATDLSARSARAIPRVADLLQRFSPKLILLHVMDDDRPSMLVESESREVRRLLKELVAEHFSEHEAGSESIVLAGHPAEQVVEAADEKDADLVVLGAHRRRVLRDVFTGTTADRVIRMGRRPVLLINREVQSPYRSVVIGIDFSDLAKQALATAKSLGLLEGAKLALVHGAGDEARSRDMYKLGDRIAEEIKKPILGEDSDALVRPLDSDPVDAIRQQVEAMEADLVVVGSRGLGGFDKARMGSVSNGIMRETRYDVLVVPPARQAPESSD